MAPRTELRPRPAPRRTPVAAAALIVLTAVFPALANMAEPPEPRTVREGRAAGEPGGSLREVAVVEERLRVDLRPLAEGRNAVVEATYRLRNDGPARRVPIWFVAEAMEPGEHGVWLDGRPVPSAPAADARLPAGWKAPAATPGPEGGDAVPYQPGRERVIAFTLPLAPGAQEVRVRYPAAAAAFQDGALMPVWQLGYVLAPAGAWGGFGVLDVRVELPRGWSAAAQPALRREGSVLTGRFDGIPADALALSARAPEPSAGWRYALVLCGLAAALFALAWMGRAVGIALGSRGRSGAWALPLACGAALVVTLLGVGAVVSVPAWVGAAAGPLANRYRISAMSYGAALLLVPLVPTLLLGGFLAVLVPAVRAARRAAPQAPSGTELADPAAVG